MPQELADVGSIKEMALFSKIVNYVDQPTTSKLREKYGNLHPKILEHGLRLSNESYSSSNQRCIAMLLALKVFVHDFQVPSNKSLNRELEGELDHIIQFIQECRPFTAGIEYSMKFIKVNYYLCMSIIDVNSLIEHQAKC